MTKTRKLQIKEGKMSSSSMFGVGNYLANRGHSSKISSVVDRSPVKFVTGASYIAKLIIPSNGTRKLGKWTIPLVSEVLVRTR